MYKSGQQKIVQTKDNSMNMTNKSGRDLSGLFKSSSALSKSLRNRNEDLENTRDQTFKNNKMSSTAYDQTFKSSNSKMSSTGYDMKMSRQTHTLSDSAKIVLTMDKMEKPKNTKDITIRNLSNYN